MNNIREQLKGGGPLPRVKKVLINGIGMHVYSIGWLALSSLASRQTLRLWETKGILPKAVLAVENGYRWFSGAEIAHYSEVIRNYFLSKPRDLKELRVKLSERSTQIRNAYRKLTPQTQKEYPPLFFGIPNEAGIAKQLGALRANKRITAVLPTYETKASKQKQTRAN